MVATFSICDNNVDMLSKEMDSQAAAGVWKQEIESQYTDIMCRDEQTRLDAVCLEIGGNAIDICGDRTEDYCQVMLGIIPGISGEIPTAAGECTRDHDCSRIPGYPPRSPCCSLIKERYKKVFCENVDDKLLDDFLSRLECPDQDCISVSSSQRVPLSLVTVIIVAVSLGWELTRN